MISIFKQFFREVGGEQNLPEYDGFSWHISRYKLLKLSHWASNSWSERSVSKKRKR